MSDPIDQEIRILRAIFWSERDPEGRAFVPLADAYLRKGDPQEALSLLGDGLGRHPGFSAAHLVAARVHRAFGNGEAVHSSLARVLDLDPENAAALRMRGELAEAEGRLDEAVSSFRAALRRNPGFEDLETRIERLSAGRPSGSAAEREFVEPVTYEPPLTPPLGGEPVSEERSPDEALSPLSGEGVIEVHAEDPDAPYEGTLFADLSESGSHAEGEDESEPGDPLQLDPSGFDLADFPAEWEGAAGLMSEVGLGDEVEVQEYDGDPGPTELGPHAPEAGGTPYEDSGALGELDAPAVPDAPRSPDAPGSLSSPDVSESSGSDMDVFDPFGFEDAPGELAEPVDSLPVTRTLGELYARQGLTAEAVSVFEALAARHPDDPSLRERLEELRGGDLPAVGWGDIEVPEGSEIAALEPETADDEIFEASTPGPVAESPDEEVWVETLEVEEVMESVLADASIADASIADASIEDASIEDASTAEEEQRADRSTRDADASPFADDSPADDSPADDSPAAVAEGEPEAVGEDAGVSPLARLAERPVAAYFRDLLAWAPGAVPIDHLAPGSTAPLPESPLATVAPPDEVITDRAPGPEETSSKEAGRSQEADMSPEVDLNSEAAPSLEADSTPQVDSRPSDSSSEDSERAFEGLDDFQDWLRSLNR